MKNQRIGGSRVGVGNEVFAALRVFDVNGNGNMEAKQGFALASCVHTNFRRLDALLRREALLRLDLDVGLQSSQSNDVRSDASWRGVPHDRAPCAPLAGAVELVPRPLAIAFVTAGRSTPRRGFTGPGSGAFLVGAERIPSPAVPLGVFAHPFSATAGLLRGVVASGSSGPLHAISVLHGPVRWRDVRWRDVRWPGGLR